MSKITRVIIAIFLLSLLFWGCRLPAATRSTTTHQEPKRFSARAESEDGAIVSWNGNTAGYQPGMEAEFGITIKNETDQDWHGRYCFQLLARKSHKVIATLEQREFMLESGVGFSDTIGIRIPEGLADGTYGLSLAVRRPAGPMVDLVPIMIGETDEERRATNQQDMDASLAACPPVGGIDTLVEQAKTDLAQRLEVDTDQIDVKSVEPTEFPDASLGVPEPGKSYAQVITPDYIVELTVGGQTYRYHASDEKILFLPNEDCLRSTDCVTVKGVTVNDSQITLHGTSTLSEGSCVNTELLANDVSLDWWPKDACARIRQGKWELIVPLEEEQRLQSSVQYIVRAYQSGFSSPIAEFPFDLSGPPGP